MAVRFHSGLLLFSYSVLEGFLLFHHELHFASGVRNDAFESANLLCSAVAEPGKACLGLRENFLTNKWLIKNTK